LQNIGLRNDLIGQAMFVNKAAECFIVGDFVHDGMEIGQSGKFIRLPDPCIGGAGP